MNAWAEYKAWINSPHPAAPTAIGSSPQASSPDSQSSPEEQERVYKMINAHSVRLGQFWLGGSSEPAPTTPSAPAIRYKDPSTGGEKDSKMERYDLVPSDSMDKVARVYGLGAQKYADRNWELGYPWGLSIAALERHISLFKQGEDLDKESQMPHLAHAAFHCLALLRFMDRHRDKDDRE